ncbi:hypothetical protein B0H15DRAFT_832325 [Mycena belliarum]|uniref:ER transporter 6TM N-terminal domain-containing protein n=1 Tax=Mycena belliarum TaxID=1033014 RepID=A0AAD6UD31_9AGAR|nr:hypothetical protein B0H15DRAFT_832325 [Mycena belliae]
MSTSSETEPIPNAKPGKEERGSLGSDSVIPQAQSTSKDIRRAGGLFAWVGPAVKKRRMLKTWLRCVLALAASLILLVNQETLTTMGQAGFFAALVAVLLPPSLALSMFALASITLLSGMLLGWAWGAATMAAGVSVQNKALLIAREVAAQKSLVSGIPPVLQLQALAFHGYFLDTRTSAVHGIMFFIGTFAMGALRATAPKLTLLSIFGTIVLDVFATTGPLLPTPNYMIATQFLLPTCFYIAIALATLVLVFPESLNHIWLTTLDGAFFGPTLSMLSLQGTTLTTRPSDHVAWAALTEKVVATRAALAGGLAALGAQIGLIDLEISVGRLGPGDLKRFAPELRALAFRASGLTAFHAAVATNNQYDLALKDPGARGAHSRFAARRRRIGAHEARHGHGLDALVPILERASAPLRTAAQEGAGVLRAWFVDCNSGRWTGFVRQKGKEAVEKRQRGLVEARDKLETTLAEFRKVERVKLVEPFERFFDRETGKLLESVARDPEEMFTVRSLFICFGFCDALDGFAARLHRVLALVAELDKKRPQPRVWLPSGFGKLGRRIMSRAPVTVEPQPLAMGTIRDPTRFERAGKAESVDGDAAEDDDDDDAPTVRNPDARAPTSALGRFFVALGAALRWFASPAGVFALRHAVVSLALWVPSVVPRTAWFFYVNKGLWALIMAQMGLAPYAGDQLAGLAGRLLGTGLGLLVGMAAWYIAAPGKADGNAYAVVIVTTVIVAPFLLARIAGPPAQMMVWMMVGVTVVFVMGYSWLDTHLQLLHSSGVGIALGWKRALLVAIGFTASAIVMMFPRPTSSRVLVRRTLAATLQELGHIFQQEVEAFLAEEARARSGEYEKETIDFSDTNGHAVSPKERRIHRVGRRALDVLERLQGVAPSLKTGRWEPQVQGLWPYEQYELLYSKQTKLVTSLALLAGAFSRLDTKWCSILVHRTPFLNPNLLSDIFSTIDILSHALDGGHPVHASLICLRDRLVYHDMHLKLPKTRAVDLEQNVALPGSEHDGDTDSESGTSEFVAGKVDGASIGVKELSLNLLMDDQMPSHSTAVIALASMLTLIDEIGAIVRELCGETTFRGFEALHHEFMGREEAALGTLQKTD